MTLRPAADQPPVLLSALESCAVSGCDSFNFLSQLLRAIEALQRGSPFQYMVTPGGLTMSVALTNCGDLGWTTDRRGYRYTPNDPLNGQPWPAMPNIFTNLARKAASAAGFENFQPDACLVNRYLPGTTLSARTIIPGYNRRNAREPTNRRTRSSRTSPQVPRSGDPSLSSQSHHDLTCR